MKVNFTIPEKVKSERIESWGILTNPDRVTITIDGATYTKDLSELNVNQAVIDNLNLYAKQTIVQLMDVDVADIEGEFLE